MRFRTRGGTHFRLQFRRRWRQSPGLPSDGVRHRIRLEAGGSLRFRVAPCDRIIVLDEGAISGAADSTDRSA